MSRKEESGPAVEKRTKIKKTKQQMMIIVLAGALIVGTCVVLMIHFGKYISFYGRVIGMKDSAIADYEKTIVNIGLCPKPKGTHYSTDEIEKCNPNTYTPSAGTLRSNITTQMAENKDLESVARDGAADICYDQETGKKYDYQALADAVADDDKRSHFLGLLKICSSLRVIPDALPAGKNNEALLASLNKIFTISGWEPDNLAPSDEVMETEIEGVETIPVSFTVDSVNASKMMTIITNMERSIRTFDVTTATIEWSGDNNLTLQAKANAYYAKDAGIVETDKTEYAVKKKRKAS